MVCYASFFVLCISNNLSFLPILHSQQATVKFSLLLVPPSFKGILWSICNVATLAVRPQYAHLKLFFSNISKRYLRYDFLWFFPVYLLIPNLLARLRIASPLLPLKYIAAVLSVNHFLLVSNVFYYGSSYASFLIIITDLCLLSTVLSKLKGMICLFFIGTTRFTVTQKFMIRSRR